MSTFTLQSPDGDVIDCVLLSHQPALDHPKLRNHQIQMEPPMLPEGLRHKTTTEEEKIDGSMFKPQLWHYVEQKCPPGTIPIRRTTENDLLRAEKINRYGKKNQRPFYPPQTALIHSSLNENGHQHAITYVEGDKYYGAKAEINVWAPSIEMPNEFSLSQLWLLAGSFEGDLNSIEAGWQVSPDLYGDNNTRLFTYWTSDAYQATGCYNLLCSGFVQISDQIALGATISPLSGYGGRQFDIDILIWKDPRAGNWWMSFGQNCVLGYWPAALFTNLAEAATMVEWGGEVVNSEPGSRHTSTQMGSGHFPSEGFGRASYFSNLQIVDASNNLQPPGNLNTFSENAACYDVENGYNSEWGYYFYYGGPGYNDRCP
ncbi:hypothetical protein KP509_21G046500 [Ceratopteris richardii]|uniref:Neprosin PEP catalytic domain-containing protein n=1 Tax=Ceratopteris richardii TaxID=49495 RepID=A0A8T2S9I6_CERRI|nr:hypothetical protein KP509_21G046500 [Ceratopteris richardii]